jgi:hypothetical protein
VHPRPQNGVRAFAECRQALEAIWKTGCVLTEYENAQRVCLLE